MGYLSALLSTLDRLFPRSCSFSFLRRRPNRSSPTELYGPATFPSAALVCAKPRLANNLCSCCAKCNRHHQGGRSRIPHKGDQHAKVSNHRSHVRGCYSSWYLDCYGPTICSVADLKSQIDQLQKLVADSRTPNSARSSDLKLLAEKREQLRTSLQNQIGALRRYQTAYQYRFSVKESQIC